MTDSATPTAPSTILLGFWSAVLATIFSIAYIVAQVAEWLGWLGSKGGPSSQSTPFGIVVLLVPSLLLGSSFLVMMVSVHQIAPPDRRVWSQAALSFATIYAALISMVYFVQLTLVGPRLAEAEWRGSSCSDSCRSTRSSTPSISSATAS